MEWSLYKGKEENQFQTISNNLASQKIIQNLVKNQDKIEIKYIYTPDKNSIISYYLKRDTPMQDVQKINIFESKDFKKPVCNTFLTNKKEKQEKSKKGFMSQVLEPNNSQEKILNKYDSNKMDIIDDYEAESLKESNKKVGNNEESVVDDAQWSQETKVLLVTGDVFDENPGILINLVEDLFSGQTNRPDLKLLFILHNVEAKIEGYFNRQRMESLSNNNGQYRFENTSANLNLPFSSYDEFHQWLLEISIDHNIDHKFTDSDIDIASYFLTLCKSHIHSRQTVISGEYETSWVKMKATHKCDMNGLQNEFSKIWVEILVTIPGLSEDKAIVIVKKYPTIKSLIDEYSNSQYTEKQKENLLAEIELKTNNIGFSEKPRRLGPSLSRKVYKFMFCNEKEELVA